MTPHLVHSVICSAARIFIFTLALILLVSGLQGTAQAQMEHTWNGVAGAEDVSYDGLESTSGYSAIGRKAISGDGRFFTFSSSRPNLVPGDSNDYPDMFVRDRLTQQTELISIGMDGAPANGASDRPSISANGRHVVFNSCATNLVPGDTNGQCDMFVRDRLAGTTSRVNIGPSDEQAQYRAYAAYGLSADGRFIVFVSAFTSNLVDARVWLRDRDTDNDGVFDEPDGVSTTQISPSPVGSSANYYYFVAISGTGRFIAYNSLNSQAGTGGMIFLHDRETGVTTRVDAPASGLPDVPRESINVDLDDAGRYLVYTSLAPNIVSDDGDNFRDLFLYDIQAGTNTRLRLSHSGAPSLQSWDSPSISGNGRYVTVTGSLTPYGSSFAYVLDLQTGASREISFADNGMPDANPYKISTMSINADGSAIAFMDCGDTWGYWQPARRVFVAIDLSLSTNAVELPQEGGSFSFNIAAPENTGWTVRTLWPDRINVAEPATGVGPGQATVNVLPNNSGIDGNIFVYVGSEKMQINQPSLSTISSVAPSSGPMSGGTEVQITGRAFAQGATVTFGGIPATDVMVVDSSTIQATTPPVTRARSVEVFVENPDGSIGRISDGFIYEDLTPPVITPVLSGTPGDNGWYISAVEVGWEVSDPESDIESTSSCETGIADYDTVLTFECTAKSFGGTTTQSVEVKIDRTPPEVFVREPEQGHAYAHDAEVFIDYICQDSYGASGIVECNAPAAPGTPLDTSEPGSYAFAVTAKDAAGNQGTNQTTYTVIKGESYVFWQTPSAIPYGVQLSTSQLNARSTVPGTFTYTPAAGTILPAGTHTLSVLFVPDDQAGYDTVTRTVQLTVQKATPATSWGTPAAIVYGTALSNAQLNAYCSLPGTFTYSPVIGTVLPAGTSTLTATFHPADTANYETISRTVSLTVLKATPIISWNPGSLTEGTPLGASQLSATANTPGTFAYTPPAGALLPAGTQILTASFTPSNTSNFEAATTSVSITVKLLSIITWPPPASIAYGTPLNTIQLNAYANTPGGFRYTPAFGTILPVGVHTLSVVFEPWDTDYANATASVSITVKAIPTISWAAPASIVYGTALGTDQLNATASVPGTFTYTPAAGTILSAGPRTLSVNFAPDDTANYANASMSVSITVQKATPEITWAVPATGKYPELLGSAQLNATANVGGTFTYSPSAGTRLAAGTHVLTVSFVPDNTVNYTNASSSVSYTIAKGTPWIHWNKPADIGYGTPLGYDQLDAYCYDPGTFTYTPALDTILPAGTHTLTATFVPSDSANYENVSQSVSITVLKAIPTITWTDKGIFYETPLGAAQLNATANVAGSFTYSPSAGTLFPVGTHSLNASFIPTDTANYENANAAITLTVFKKTPDILWTAPANIIYGTPLSPIQLNANAGVPGTYTYMPGLGTILPAGTHTLKVIFEPNDLGNYNKVATSVPLTVQKATPTVTWITPGNIVYGTRLSAAQLNATSNVAGAFIYTPDLGLMLPAGIHTLSALFIPTDTANYYQASATVPLTVEPAALVVQTNMVEKTYGQALPAFTARGTGFVNGDSMASLSGVLTFTTSATSTSSPGTYPVTPGGVSSPNYTIDFVAGTLIITYASTSTTLVSTPNPSSNRQTVQLTATVIPIAPGAGLPTGTIQFLDNGVVVGAASLVNGVATKSVSFRKGTHSLNAIYSGDTNFRVSSGTLSHQVR